MLGKGFWVTGGTPQRPMGGLRCRKGFWVAGGQLRWALQSGRAGEPGAPAPSPGAGGDGPATAPRGRSSLVTTAGERVGCAVPASAACCVTSILGQEPILCVERDGSAYLSAEFIKRMSRPSHRKGPREDSSEI